MKRRGNFASKSDIGKVRETNEDVALALTNKGGDVLLVVCDGMGGHSRGDLAAKIAADYLADSFKAKNSFFTMGTARLWLTYHIKQANRLIYDEALRNPKAKEMGTTLTVALLVDNQVAIANIGDSRAYAIGQDGLRQLSEDQTYVDFLFRSGKISKDQMKTHPQKHVLLNALGLNPTITIDMKIFDYKGERLLVCSDGLYNNVSDIELLTTLLSGDTPIQKCDALIRIANSNGGTDNIAVSIWEPQSA
jgi:protein phosphatase